MPDDLDWVPDALEELADEGKAYPWTLRDLAVVIRTIQRRPGEQD